MTTAKTIPNNNAYQNPSTWKLSPIIALANKIIIAVITKENNPNVKIVTGKLIKFKTGFTIAFKSPITIATIIAEPYPFTDTPGKM